MCLKIAGQTEKKSDGVQSILDFLESYYEFVHENPHLVRPLPSEEVRKGGRYIRFLSNTKHKNNNYLLSFSYNTNNKNRDGRRTIGRICFTIHS